MKTPFLASLAFIGLTVAALFTVVMPPGTVAVVSSESKAMAGDIAMVDIATIGGEYYIDTMTADGIIANATDPIDVPPWWAATDRHGTMMISFSGASSIAPGDTGINIANAGASSA